MFSIFRKKWCKTSNIVLEIEKMGTFWVSVPEIEKRVTFWEKVAVFKKELRLKCHQIVSFSISNSTIFQAENLKPLILCKCIVPFCLTVLKKGCFFNACKSPQKGLFSTTYQMPPPEKWKMYYEICIELPREMHRSPILVYTWGLFHESGKSIFV